jgi:hypothetical protein
MIRGKVSLNNGFTAVLAGYAAAKGSQVGIIRLFAPHEKLLCAKTKTLA